MEIKLIKERPVDVKVRSEEHWLSVILGQSIEPALRTNIFAARSKDFPV